MSAQALIGDINRDLGQRTHYSHPLNTLAEQLSETIIYHSRPKSLLLLEWYHV